MVNVSELDMRGKLLYRTLTDIILQKYLAWSLHPFSQMQSKRSQSTWENSNQQIRLLIMSRNEEKRQAFQNR